MGWSVKSDRGLFPTTVAFDTPRALPGGSPQTDVGLAQKLRTDGYAVIDAKLPQVLLDACRACIDDSAKGVASLSAAHRHRDRYQGDHLFLGFSRADELREATIVDTVFAKLIACPQLLAAFAAVGVAQPAFWAGSIMSKPPGAPPLYWHHDWAFWDRHELSRQPDPAQIFAMVYLTDTTVENGCLRVLPGSHRQRLPIHDALAALQADGKGPSHGSWETQAPWEEEGHGSPLFSKCDGHEVEPVDVQVQAGQLVLGDARVLHCTHPNKSLTRRSMLTLWYLNKGSTAVPPALEAYYARSAKPSTSNLPYDPDHWSLLQKVALDPIALAGIAPIESMLDWQGGGPPSRAKL